MGQDQEFMKLSFLKLSPRLCSAPVHLVQSSHRFLPNPTIFYPILWIFIQSTVRILEPFLGINILRVLLNTWHPDNLFRLDLEHIIVVPHPPSLYELSSLENSGLAESQREIW